MPEMAAHATQRASARASDEKEQNQKNPTRAGRPLVSTYATARAVRYRDTRAAGEEL